MVETIPPGVKAEGRSKVAYVPAISSMTAPTLAEINAAGSLNISFFLKAGQFQPNKEQARGDDRRYGSQQTFQKLGRINPSIEDIVYVADPQAAPAEANNRAMELFQPGVVGFFVVRWGLDVVTVDWAADQKVDVWPIEFGAQRKTPLAEDDEFAPITITQAVAVTGPVIDQAEIAA